jgi:hypothetical protein
LGVWERKRELDSTHMIPCYFQSTYAFTQSWMFNEFLLFVDL